MPAAIAIPALISAGASVGSSVIGSRAAGKAADAQKDAAQKALDFQNQVYQDQRSLQQPFAEAGKQGIGQLMEAFQNGTFGPGSIDKFAAPSLEEARQSPGYQFAQQQGNRGVAASAAARGGALSGGALKALSRFNVGLADQTYGNVFNRALQAYGANLQGQGQEFGQLMGFTGLGQNAIQNIGNTGVMAARNIGDLMGQYGNAASAGSIAQGNIWGGLAGQLGNLGGQVYGQTHPQIPPYDPNQFPTQPAPFPATYGA